MALYETDFSEYTLGVAPTGWTERWATTDFSLNIIARDAKFLRPASGGQNLQVNVAATDVFAASWDAVGTPADVDMIGKVLTVGAASEGIQVYVRGGGAEGAEDGYGLTIGTDGSAGIVRIFKRVAGAASALATKNIVGAADTAYLFRFRVEGTALKAKLWSENEFEPTEWLLETTDSDLSSGWVAVSGYLTAADPKYDFLMVETSPGSDSNFPPTDYFDGTYGKFGLLGPVSQYVGVLGTIATSYVVGPDADGFTLTDIAAYFRFVPASGEFRFAVYRGGSAANPEGALLLWDSGSLDQVDQTAVYTVFSMDDVLVAEGDRLWVVIKSDDGNMDIWRTTDNGAQGNQVAAGRWYTTIINQSPAVAYPSTWPTDAVGSFDALKHDYLEIRATPPLAPPPGPYVPTSGSSAVSNMKPEDLENSVSKIVFKMEVQGAYEPPKWWPLPTEAPSEYQGMWYTDLAYEVAGVRVDGGDAEQYDSAADLSGVAAKSSGYYWDEENARLYVVAHRDNPMDTDQVHTQVMIQVRLSNVPKDFDDWPYDARMKVGEVPDWEVGVQARFGGRPKWGGGSIKLLNTDKALTGLEYIDLDAGFANISIGLDERD